jgi:predicted metal-dependent HD superfamily phosphohydrolase
MRERSPEKSDEALCRDMDARWLALFGNWTNATANAFSRLYDAYTDEWRHDRSTGRHYHNLGHIRACLVELDRCAARLGEPRAVAAAIWFHDVVYEPTRSDNEERSADWAERYLREMGEGDALVAAVRRLILDTRHREPPETSDGRYVVDIDLSSLGKPWEAFMADSRAIRAEYAHVPEDAFRIGRANVLRSFLAREWIYYTPEFREAFESAARANLARSVAELTRGGGL